MDFDDTINDKGKEEELYGMESGKKFTFDIASNNKCSIRFF